jgi:hypothetical protein
LDLDLARGLGQRQRLGRRASRENEDEQEGNTHSRKLARTGLLVQERGARPALGRIAERRSRVYGNTTLEDDTTAREAHARNVIGTGEFVQGSGTMATRPVQDFHWADVGGSIVDPGAPKKDLGFVTAERPPASWFNYLFNLIQQWNTYHDETLNTDLVTALGGTPEVSTLPDLFTQGTFTPITANNQAQVTYSSQLGVYQRVGKMVHCWFTVGWTNSETAQDTNPVEFIPPFDLSGTSVYVGTLDYFSSNFGTAGANITTAVPVLTSTFGGIRIRGRATTMNSTTVSLAYGDDNARVAVGYIAYPTDGVFNY